MRNALSWFAVLAAAFAFTGCGEEPSTSADAQVEATTEPTLDATAEVDDDTADVAEVVPEEVDAPADEAPKKSTKKSSAPDPKALDYNEVISPYLNELLADPSTADSGAASGALKDLAADERDAECSRVAKDTAKEIMDESGTADDRRARILDASAMLQLC